MMSRRTFASTFAAGATGLLMPHLTRAANGAAAQNIVLVHGLFADGSCWVEVIARLQAAGLNMTSVQSPLTMPDDAVAETRCVLAGRHSFSGMIVTEVSNGRDLETDNTN